ncbi:hypothetical protein [Thiohalocapsa marina]|uniref:hypothetical protein n=1 Tax=Thiohalocapsa marina TaxID=424902 RepID=UPI0036DE05FA|nr:hypothetical protein [Sphingobacteriia bacterium]NCC41066.1 hypothetical protein [Gammaproteobacteria bacterium]
MQITQSIDLKKAVDTAARIRERMASLDVGMITTRAVGGAVILTASFLVIANPNAPQSGDPSEVIAARIAPIGTVQLAAPTLPAESR